MTTAQRIIDPRNWNVYWWKVAASIAPPGSQSNDFRRFHRLFWGHFSAARQLGFPTGTEEQTKQSCCAEAGLWWKNLKGRFAMAKTLAVEKYGTGIQSILCDYLTIQSILRSLRSLRSLRLSLTSKHCAVSECLANAWSIFLSLLLATFHTSSDLPTTILCFLNLFSSAFLSSLSPPVAEVFILLSALIDGKQAGVEIKQASIEEES